MKAGGIVNLSETRNVRWALTLAILACCLLLPGPQRACAGITTPAGADSSVTADVVTIGESITFGHGASDPSHAWPAVLGDLNHLVVLNKGVGPNTTAQMRERFNADVVAHSPKAVIITGGIADLFEFVPPATTRENLSWMVQTALANGIQPYLGTMTPAVPFHPQTASLNAWMASYAEMNPGVGVIDFFTPLESPVGSGSCAYLVDIVHPDNYGYLLMGIAAAEIVPTHATAIGNDYGATSQGTTLAVPSPGVLANDVAFAGSTGSYAALIRGTLHGALSLQPDGSYTYLPEPSFIGTDTFLYRKRSGADSSALATVTIRVRDTVAPVTRISELPAGWSRNPVIVSLSATDAPQGSGVETTYLRFGDGLPQRYSMAAIVTSEGATDIEYWSVDRAGNEETPHKKAAFKVDTTAPVTTSNAKATYYASASIRLIRSDGGISGIAATEWQLDASTWTSGTAVDVTKLGTHTLRFRSTDVAGNREGTKVRTFKIVPLAITPTAGAGGSISPGTIQTVKPGASSTFTVTPKSGYRISNVKVDGVSKGAIAVYAFSDVVVSHTITASFAATSTSISLSTRSNSSLGYKKTFQVGGHFKVGSAGTAKQRVILQSRAPGEVFTDTSQRATTGTGGRFTFSVQPSATTHYRVRFAAANGYGGSHAPTSVYAKPRVRLTRSTSWMSLSRSKKYYSRGFISPRHANADSNKIRIRAYKRGVHGRYYYVKSFMASYAYFNSARTEYKAAVRLTSRGTWKLVAYHASDTNNAKTYGSADYVRVY